MPGENLNTPTSLEPAGLYIHIPFCIRKCFYCNFYSVTDLGLQNDFVKALRREMRLVNTSGLSFDTLYIGGGTPSTLSASNIDRIIEQSGQSFHFLPSVEVTLEINPGTVNREDLSNYRTAGVNRLNIGVQSFNDASLQMLGRLHSSQDATQTFKQARQKGFANIGLDLIYGLSGQTLMQWRRDLQMAISLEPEHISCYILTYEMGAALDNMKRRGLITPLPDERICEFYDAAVQYLSAHGYEQYEIANFARIDKGDDYRSLHNYKYWSFAPYIGLGPSAHSYVHPFRWWNHSDISVYIDAIRKSASPAADRERLTQRQQMIETLYVKLRTRQGIDLIQFEKIFGMRLTDEFASLIRFLEKQRKLTCTPTKIALTPEGMLHHNAITLMFL